MCPRARPRKAGKKWECQSLPSDRGMGRTNTIQAGRLDLELDHHVAPHGLQCLDLSAMSGDGRALPAWLGRPSFNRLEGLPPAGQSVLDLRVHALLSDGTVIRRELRIDLATGAIERREPQRRAREVPLFGEQIRKFAHLSDAGVSTISAALHPDVSTSK